MNSRRRLGDADAARRREGGFTLLEMVISVVLLTLITGAISAAFVSALNATAATKTRVTETNDAQLIAAFFTRDGQAAGGTNPATGTANPTLGATAPAANGCSPTAAPVPGITSFIGFEWIDLASATTYETTYSYVTAATVVGTITYAPQELLRTICSTTSATPPVTSSGTSVLATNIVTTAAGTLQPPFAGCSAPATACPTGILNPPTTTTVYMTMSDYNQNPSNATTSYTFTLSASLRPQAGSGPDTSSTAAAAPMLLLGDGGVCSSASIEAGGASGVEIFGEGTVSSGCKTMDAHGCGGPSGCGDQASGGMFAYSPTPGDPDACGQVDGTCTQVPHPYPDPFAAEIQSGQLTVPSTAGCNNGSNPSPNGAGNYSGSTTFPQLFNLNQVTTFSPGVYVFCKGIAAKKDMTAGPDASGNGSLFYIATGGVAVNGGTLAITAPNAGEYDGLALWQAAGDTTELTGGTVEIDGTAYLPSARVTFKNGSDYMQQLVCAGLDLQSGNNTTQLGPTLAITSAAALPNATQGQPYSTTVTASGGAPAYTFSASGLPSTMHIDANTGVISGTPNANTNGGTINITITVKGFFGTGRDVDTQTATLEVLSAPTVTGANPNAMNRTGSRTVTISGTNFVTGATASFNDAGITVSNPNVSNSTTMTATVTVTGSAALGLHNITVTNGDGVVATGNNLFTVGAAPTLTGANLNTMDRGASNQTVTLTGSGFITGATASFGSNITASNFNVVNSTTMTVHVSVANTAVLGARNVVVTNTDGSSATGTNIFTVQGVPTVTQAVPNTLTRPQTNVNISVVGTNFVPGPALTAAFSGSNVTVNSTTFVDSSHLTLNITITSGASQTSRNITVTNADGTTASGSSLFKVN